MHETQKIVDLWKRARRKGDFVYLATVVHVQGSSYRKPGARMLVTSGGERAGTISGGCLEGEISRKIAWHTSKGSAIHSYRSAFDDEFDDVKYGLGCGGKIWILMESGADATPTLNALERAVDERLPSVIVSSLSRKVGTAAVLSGESLDQTSYIEVSTSLDDLPIAQMRRSMASLRCIPSASSPSDTIPHFLSMPISPPTRLLICGAGDDAQPLARLAAELGWEIHVLDGRSDLVRRERFPQARDLKVLPFESGPSASFGSVLEGSIGVCAGDLAVIMTHSYEQDRALLAALLPEPLRYLGLLGPLHRTRRLLASVAPFVNLSEEECLARLHAPVGLEIGTSDPSSIAFSIVAEMQAELMGKNVYVKPQISPNGSAQYQCGQRALSVV